MSNTTPPFQLLSNNVSLTNQRLAVPIRTFMGFLSVSPCLLFLYINTVMLYSLKSKPMFRETSRYILFGNLLFADTILLVTSQLLYILAVAGLFVIRYICVVIVLVAIFTSAVSPLNLSVMSLERYVAICYPLRHASIVTPGTTGVVIAVVWILCSLNTIIKLIMLLVLESMPLDQLMQEFCSTSQLFHLKIHNQVDNVFISIVFITVSFIIIYSYIAMMMVAKSASSDKDLNTKARNTVLLHLIQLGLSLSSTLVPTIVSALKSKAMDKATQIEYIVFIILIILPRCLSPLIYGLRDQTFRHILVYHLTCGLRCTVQPIKISSY
ncbi:odorant receptor 131-2-like [Coregonus clupeaformis]|uniref:odorant receptor 131-2-like n=1 Tax=Coregonus clupeaformis TaxID=59861 RepID=UPI001BE0B1E1|nr:odorant receptor 131-2-like [Coregonus clupeaformis]